MAANYWESTQRRCWQFTKDELASMRQSLEDEDPGLVHMFPLPQTRHLNIYYNQHLNRLGKRMAVRQQAIATAQVYLKRFYSKVEIRRTNPYLMVATALYLACKMEECPQHIRLIVTEARSQWPTDFMNLDTSKLGEAEFWLISEMNSQLIVHQPYRTLTSLQADFNLGPEEVALAWSTINDSYMTDLPLLYPPHVIALTGILLALVLRPMPPGSNSGSTPTTQAGGQVSANMGMAAVQAALNPASASVQARAAAAMIAGAGGGNILLQAQAQVQAGAGGGQQQGEAGAKKVPDERVSKVQRFAVWLAESSIDIEQMIDATQELISFYECHDQYNEKLTREQINRYVKARGLDK